MSVHQLPVLMEVSVWMVSTDSPVTVQLATPASSVNQVSQKIMID